MLTTFNTLISVNIYRQQWRLFGYVAAAVVFRMYVVSFNKIYLGIVEKSNSGQRIDNLSEAVGEVHAMVSSSKPALTWAVLRAAQHCREACGGHGFLKSARLGDIRSNHEPTVTYEGDNNVLSQQAGNWLLRQYEAALSGAPVDSPLGSVAFLQRLNTARQARFRATQPRQLASPASETARVACVQGRNTVQANFRATQPRQLASLACEYAAWYKLTSEPHSLGSLCHLLVSCVTAKYTLY
ncbi:hypothetical protein ACJJTC_002080 [Scirpophaga incertulas]